jgi:hypothetical protein
VGFIRPQVTLGRPEGQGTHDALDQMKDGLGWGPGGAAVTRTRDLGSGGLVPLSAAGAGGARLFRNPDTKSGHRVRARDRACGWSGRRFCAGTWIELMESHGRLCDPPL